MGFTSLAFLLFFLIVWFFYLMLPGRFRTAWLLLASYVFLGSFKFSWLLVLLASTLTTYICGLSLERLREAGEKKRRAAGFLFAFAVGVHVLALSFFKFNRFQILLPVGLSFYTFQAIGYLADIWRGEEKAEKNFLVFALFQAFFPKLVQGPIERSGNLLRQIRELPQKRVRDIGRIRSGGLLILWGLTEKLLIADRIAIPVNAVYSQFGAFGGVEIVLATFLYAFQIYCDFCGYTDIARGTAEILGFDLLCNFRFGAFGGVEIVLATFLYAFQIYCDFCGYTDIARGTAEILGFDLLCNFRRPYLADSIQDFWRRWHLSLSSWLRDYVYIPLGGSRKGKLRRGINIMATFLISGIWHGTGLHFLVWGGLHGLGQIFDIKNWRLPRWMKRVLVFLFVDLTWMVFRVNSLGDLKGMLLIIFQNFRLGDFAGMQLVPFEWLLVVLGILLVTGKDLANERGIALRPWILSRNAVARCLIYTGLISAVVIFGVYGAAYDTSGFLYTQF